MARRPSRGLGRRVGEVAQDARNADAPRGWRGTAPRGCSSASRTASTLPNSVGMTTAVRYSVGTPCCAEVELRQKPRRQEGGDELIDDADGDVVRRNRARTAGPAASAARAAVRRARRPARAPRASPRARRRRRRRSDGAAPSDGRARRTAAGSRSPAPARRARRRRGNTRRGRAASSSARSRRRRARSTARPATASSRSRVRFAIRSTTWRYWSRVVNVIRA